MKMKLVMWSTVLSTALALLGCQATPPQLAYPTGSKARVPVGSPTKQQTTPHADGTDDGL
jgi:hypothetical protein